jgi:hypothetical protein
MSLPDFFHRKPSDIVSSQEQLPATRRRRLLVMGTTMSGVWDLQRQLQEVLKRKGITDVEVEVLKEAPEIIHSFYGNDSKGFQQPAGNDVPIGVVLLPEMRQHDPWTGAGMTVFSHGTGLSDLVERLCAQHGVQLVQIYPGGDMSKQIAQAAIQIARPAK